MEIRQRLERDLLEIFNGKESVLNENLVNIVGEIFDYKIEDTGLYEKLTVRFIEKLNDIDNMLNKGGLINIDGKNYFTILDCDNKNPIDGIITEKKYIISSIGFIPSIINDAVLSVSPFNISITLNLTKTYIDEFSNEVNIEKSININLGEYDSAGKNINNYIDFIEERMQKYLLNIKLGDYKIYDVKPSMNIQGLYRYIINNIASKYIDIIKLNN